MVSRVNSTKYFKRNGQQFLKISQTLKEEGTFPNSFFQARLP